MGIDMRKKLSSGGCEQQRRRPACTYCYLLIGKYCLKTCCKQNFTILAIVSVAIIVSVPEQAGFHITSSKPEDRFCHVTACMCTEIVSVISDLSSPHAVWSHSCHHLYSPWFRTARKLLHSQCIREWVSSFDILQNASLAVLIKGISVFKFFFWRVTELKIRVHTCRLIFSFLTHRRNHVCTQKNRLNEKDLLSTLKKCKN